MLNGLDSGMRALDGLPSYSPLRTGPSGVARSSSSRKQDPSADPQAEAPGGANCLLEEQVNR